MTKKGVPLSASIRKRFLPPPLRPREEFWAEFRRRAASRNGAAALDRQVRLRRVIWWSAAAAVLVLLAAVWGTRLRTSNLGAGVSLAAGPNVDDVDVLVKHGSVIVFEDAQHRATIVWVSLPRARSSPKARGG